MWISINIAGYIADLLRGKKILDTTQTRKIFNGIGKLIGDIIIKIKTL